MCNLALRKLSCIFSVITIFLNKYNIIVERIIFLGFNWDYIGKFSQNKGVTHDFNDNKNSFDRWRTQTNVIDWLIHMFSF